MTNLQAKKRVENIVNWSVHYGQIALTSEDIEALNKLIAISDIYMTAMAYMLKGSDEQ